MISKNVRFPQVHIATSVQNRLMDIARQIKPPMPQIRDVPTVNDPSNLGGLIEQSTATEVPPMAAPSQAEAAAMTGALDEGTSAADEVGDQAILENFT